jgi:hypothetical protein
MMGLGFSWLSRLPELFSFSSLTHSIQMGTPSRGIFFFPWFSETPSTDKIIYWDSHTTYFATEPVWIIEKAEPNLRILVPNRRILVPKFRASNRQSRYWSHPTKQSSMSKRKLSLIGKFDFPCKIFFWTSFLSQESEVDF